MSNEEPQGIGNFLPTAPPPPPMFKSVTQPPPKVEDKVAVDEPFEDGIITEIPNESELQIDPVFNTAHKNLTRIIANYDTHMVGQYQLRESLLIGLLTGGHILLESVPGLAKTTAAQTLALSIQGKFSRIQCTPDLLPSDILGTEIFDQKTGSFKTELGPVHANFVLLDEINRSSAKTQSAMLEAMQEKQTTIGGTIYKLPQPFQVIATQNPIEQEGTYPLPEAQLDRFLMKDVLSYSTPEEEFEILARLDTGALDSSKTDAVVSVDEVLEMQQVAMKIYVSDEIRSYIVNLVDATRNLERYIPGLASSVEVGSSVRGGIALLQCSRAVAFIEGRNHVIPEDVKKVAERVLQHRILMTYDAPVNGIYSTTVISELLKLLPVP